MHLALKITKREGTHRHSYQCGNSQSFHFIQNNTTPQKTEGKKKCFQNLTMAEFILLFLYSTCIQPINITVKHILYFYIKPTATWFHF